ERAHVIEGTASATNHWRGLDHGARPRGLDSEGRLAAMRSVGPVELDPAFAWLRPPILNKLTRLAMGAGAALGPVVARGYEGAGGAAGGGGEAPGGGSAGAGRRKRGPPPRAPALDKRARGRGAGGAAAGGPPLAFDAEHPTRRRHGVELDPVVVGRPVGLHGS